MRTVVSAPGRFHLFHLAGELLNRGVLQRLFTAYPRSRLELRLQPLATTLPSHGLLGFAVARMDDGSVRRELEWQFISRYDRAVARRLPDADIVVGLSGRVLYTLRRAKQLGARAVCDRGSSHIAHQDAVLAEEYSRWGVPYSPVDPRGLAKELAEYDEADLITVPSRFARNTFEAHGVPSSKIAVIPYGVDLSMFRPAQRNDSRFRVFFAGRVSLQKGVPYLLQAVRPLKSERGFDVWLAGNVDPAARYWLGPFEGRFRLLGNLPRRDLARVYASSSVFVLPSVQEGLALVIGQAMASGLPVIATAETGAEELLTDGIEGFIVPPRSPDAIRDRLLRLYEDGDLRRRMGAAARARAISLGGWARYGELALRSYAGIGS